MNGFWDLERTYERTNERTNIRTDGSETIDPQRRWRGTKNDPFSGKGSRFALFNGIFKNFGDFLQIFVTFPSKYIHRAIKRGIICVVWTIRGGPSSVWKMSSPGKKIRKINFLGPFSQICVKKWPKMLSSGLFHSKYMLFGIGRFIFWKRLLKFWLRSSYFSRNQNRLTKCHKNTEISLKKT